ncbi:MAG: phage holin family protein [Dokdonella sp.]
MHDDDETVPDGPAASAVKADAAPAGDIDAGDINAGVKQSIGVEAIYLQLEDAGKAALRVAEAALTLVRAEFALARHSALGLIWLGFALVFFGVGAWLATSAAIAAGIYQITGNMFVGIGVVALLNLVGVIAVLMLMRRNWRDLGFPRTRRMISDASPGSKNEDT